jgi:hypothetical protein
MRRKVSRSFYEDEFIYPSGNFCDVDPQLVGIAQWIRDTLDKPVTINNYATGGNYKESGLRSKTTTTGAKKSAHKEGKAIDIKVKGMTAKEVYDWCLVNQMKLYELGVREIEDQKYTASWVHIGTRGNHLSIKIIKP